MRYGRCGGRKREAWRRSNGYVVVVKTGCFRCRRRFPWRRIRRCRVAVALLRYELDIRDGADEVGPVVSVSRLDMHVAQGDKQRGSLWSSTVASARRSPQSEAGRYPLRWLFPFSSFMPLVVCQRKRCNLLAARRVADFYPVQGGQFLNSFMLSFLFDFRAAQSARRCGNRIPGLQCISNCSLVWCRRRRWLYGHHLCWQ